MSPRRPGRSGAVGATSATGATGAARSGRENRRRRRRARGPLLVGAALVGMVIAVALVSFVWTPHDPLRIDNTPRLLAPSAEHWLGTDALGRDVASRIMMGSRTTLFVGLVAVGVAALLGVPIGLVAAMSPRRWLDELLMRVADVMLAFPALLLAIMLSAVFGASTLMAMIAIGLASVPQFARVTRSGAWQVMGRDYVLAARIAGRRPAAIAVRHVLPNIASLVIVQSSVSFAIAVLAEAGLSYLGLGTPPPTPSWGRMLQESQPFLALEPLLVLVPGAAIATAVLGFNLLGDGLRDLLDPRLEGR